MKIIRRKGAGRIRIVEHNKKLLVIIGILLAVLVVIVGYLAIIEKENNKSGNGQQIGGDKDEHGCLIAAGYSWNETKQKCVREFEEAGKGYCSDEDKSANVCTAVWEPVCGNAFETEPGMMPKTYSNSCAACMDKNVEYWVAGECAEE